MKRIPILCLLLGVLACNQHASTQQPGTSSKDSALYSDIVRPVTDSIHQFPDNSSLYYRRALLLFNTDPSLALTDFEKAASIDPANTDYWAGAGEAALVSNDFKKAAHNFQQALQTAPGYTYLQYRLATAWVENKQYEQADSLANVLSKSADGRDKAFYLKARMAEDKQDTVTAIKHLAAAVQVAGQVPEFEAVMELADLLRARKAPAALNYYMLAWKLDTTNAHPVYEAGQYQEELNNPAAAMQAYKQCIVADPGFEQAYLAMGKIYLNKKEWKEAFNYFNMAAKAAPTDAWAYYYRAVCLEEQGKKQDALADYTKAASFKKDFKEALTAIKRLNP